MELSGGAVVLRPWRAGDEEALVRGADDREIWRNLTDAFPHPYRGEHASAWIRWNLEQEGPPAQFAVIPAGAAAGQGPEAGSPVGGIGFERLPDIHRRTARVGYWIARRHWGKGYATEAVRLVSAHAFAHFDFVRLEAEVLDWNPASRRVLEKAGFVLESRQRRRIEKDGVILDGWLYARWREAPGASGENENAARAAPGRRVRSRSKTG